ncbi:hypothetical protein ACS0TY_014952 [Phlomoides rotata]
MAASANPAAGGHSNISNGGNNSGNSNGGGPEKANGGGGLSTTENSVAKPALRGLVHNPGISLAWTPEEQSTLEELLLEYTSDSVVLRYSRIALALTDKTARDVALRCRWMSKKENGKRRKDEISSSRKSKDKKEKNMDSLPKSSQVANRSNGPPYLQSMDSDDGISCKAIGGAVGQLLEQTAMALDQIYSNFSAYKVNENITLLSQARANIYSVLNDFHDVSETMARMPPLSVKVNDELANTFLSPLPLPKKPHRSHT